MVKSCLKCNHLFMDGGGWELPQFDYPNCNKHPNLANLKSFPFKDTKCPSFSLKGVK